MPNASLPETRSMDITGLSRDPIDPVWVRNAISLFSICYMQQSNPETYLDLWCTITGICIKLWFRNPGKIPVENATDNYWRTVVCTKSRFIKKNYIFSLFSPDTYFPYLCLLLRVKTFSKRTRRFIVLIQDLIMIYIFP